MDRFVWVLADESVGTWEDRAALIEAAAQAGADGIVVEAADYERARHQFSNTIATLHAGRDGQVLEVAEAETPPGDVVVVGRHGEGDGTVDRPAERDASGDVAVLEDLDDPAAAYVTFDDAAAADLAEWVADPADFVILEGDDWEVIPLENLIASVGDRTSVVATVRDAEGAKTAFDTLEVGADGVMVRTADPATVRAVVDATASADREPLALSWARVAAVESTGLADRVCVDTGSMLDSNEGMLVGSHARGLVFVHGETEDGPYTTARPFRVNAGAVHAYIRVPGDETRYLSEVGAGDHVIVIDTEGNPREAIVGRTKIERRPMVRLALETEDGDTVETLLQEAETVRVHTREGGPTPVTDLAVDDEVAIHYEDVARHFGTALDEETIHER